MKIYLAGNGGYKKDCVQNVYDSMNVYIAGVSGEKSRVLKSGLLNDRLQMLESFYYIHDWMLPFIKNDWDFILDSGAFTFMSNADKADGIDWDEYTIKYAKFVKEHDIDLFFELDIDSIVGIKEVERLRVLLEEVSAKRCIPVWHKSRGLDYWKSMCQDYDYVAIGGIVSKEITRKDFKYFTPMLNIARERNCKVHGLGFTQTKLLKKYPFYSVDSTSWLYGTIGVYLYHFNGKEMDKIMKPSGKVMNAKEVTLHNFKQWVLFQKYAKHNL